MPYRTGLQQLQAIAHKKPGIVILSHNRVVLEHRLRTQKTLLSLFTGIKCSFSS
ncbi:hypothetical protein CEV34_2038 [Brucella pseudogrignonensis]|uniref:Uncharacterized protein n=1 Tax=Brucella pseudogrignonensis TaxID=419475 RepID=A0A256GL85_9HYPH|nr:hypothetical protein CEV34_2038 [Brucella pseudogrignonensis]